MVVPTVIWLDVQSHIYADKHISKNQNSDYLPNLPDEFPNNHH